MACLRAAIFRRRIGCQRRKSKLCLASILEKRITVEVGRHTGGIDSSDYDTRQSAVWACGGLFEELLIGLEVRHDDSFLLVPVKVILCLSRTELARRQVEWRKDSILRFERRMKEDEEG